MSNSSNEPDFDVVVVGAGVAGCVAAYLLATRGHAVALLERGETVGAKNLSGGVLYSRVLEQVFPGFSGDAPLERRIVRNVLSFLNATSSVAVDYRDERLGASSNAFTVLRARLDPWLAARCEDAGVTVLPGITVDELVTEPGPGNTQRVVGVRAGEDILRTRVTIAADGVNSFCATQLGLRTRPATNQLAVGVKCIVELPRERIEDRFGLERAEGAALALVGECTQGIGGGGFLYTNEDSLSVGIVLRLDDLLARSANVTDVFAAYLRHPVLARYLDGGRIIEFGSHLVAEGGAAMVGEVSTGGMVVVGEAAGLALNTGLTVRGMDLAAGSAQVAAEVVDAALTNGDTTASGLAGYRAALMDSVVGRDMARYRRAPRFLERPRLYDGYGELLADVLHGVYDHDLSPRRPLATVAYQALRRSPLRMRDLLSDAVAGVRAL